MNDGMSWLHPVETGQKTFISLRLGEKPPDGYVWTTYVMDEGEYPVCVKKSWLESLNEIQEWQKAPVKGPSIELLPPDWVAFSITPGWLP